MNTTKRFADKLFTIAFRAAFKFFRRPAVQAVAAEAADRAKPAPGAMSWLAAPAGARTWEEALGAFGDARRQQAMQADQPID